MSSNRSASTIVASVLLLSACAIDKMDRAGCEVTTGAITRDGRSGVVLSNTCGTCIAVGFEYVGGAGESGKAACFVPAETRVVHWGVQDHRTIQQRDCDAVREDGMRGVASAEEVLRNHQTGACEILGVFAD